MDLDYNCYIMTKNEKIKLIGILVIGFILVGIVFYESISVLILIPFIYKWSVKIYSEIMKNKRKDKLILQFKDFLYSISSSFAAGRHMSESLLEAKLNLEDVYDSTEPIMLEVNHMIEKVNYIGETDINVMEDFAKRSHIEDIENFTQIFKACRETGGDFVSSMNKSATIIGEKITIENEIKTMIAQKHLEGRIITLMPVAIIVFLRIMSPDYLEVMYTTLAGRIMMTTALIATACAYIWIERITKIEV